MKWGLATAAVCLAAAACQFDTSGAPFQDGGPASDAGPRGDGGSPDDAPDGVDAGPCVEDIHLELSVDGRTEPLGAGEPYIHVLVGDTVTLSASGSCSSTGALLYNWQVEPLDGTRETALPHTQAETITVYPLAVDTYDVTLTIADNNGRNAELTVIAFEAHGWSTLNGVSNIKELDVGRGTLWIAHDSGADRMSLTDPGTFVDIIAEADPGSDPPLEGKYDTTYVDADDLVWFGNKDPRSGVWRLDYDQQPPRSTFHPYDTALGVADATVRDIGAGATGVAVATNEGVAFAIDNTVFTDSFVPAAPDVRAVTAGGGQRWAGGTKLYHLNDNDAASEPFGVADNKIRALAIDVANDELWVATLDIGIARVDNTSGAVIAVYTAMNTVPLTTDKLRYVTVETVGAHAGDAWVATDKGVARYKRDRDTWLIMGNGFGLNGQNDVRTVTVDEGNGRRVIYAGTNSGVVYIRAP